MIGSLKLSALALAAVIGVTGLSGAASAADYRGQPHFQFQQNDRFQNDRMDHGPGYFWLLRHRHQHHEFFRILPWWHHGHRG